LRSFIKLPLKMRLLLIGTFWLLGIVRLAIFILPFRYLTPFMGKKMAESPAEIDPKLLAKAVKIGWSVNVVSSITPWENRCLVRAFAAQIILLILKTPSTLYLGLKKNDSRQLQAHAWLRCGTLTLIGARERESYKSIVQFAHL